MPMKMLRFVSHKINLTILLCLVLLSYGFIVRADSAQTGPIFTVTTTVDVNDGQCGVTHCTLREAVIAANSLGQPATINVPAGTYNLTITGTNEDAALTGDLDITNETEIIGAGANTTIIDANGIDRIFDGINNHLTIRNVTIQGGNADYGGGIRYRNNGDSQYLYLSYSTVQGNTATDGGGIALISGPYNQTPSGIFFSQVKDNHSTNHGGGIYLEYSEVLLDASIDNNIADADGGGIYASDAQIYTPIGEQLYGPGTEIYGTGAITNNTALNGGGIFVNVSDNPYISILYLTQATIAGNHALNDGGGILINANNTSISANIAYSTIADNVADSDNNANGSGGGLAVWSSNDVLVGESIVYNNTANRTPSDCYLDDPINYSIQIPDYTLMGNSTGCSFLDDTKLISGQDPLLGTLDYHGGNTLVYSLLPNSPALDLITDPNLCGAPNGITNDQRGVTRPQGAGCDIGAYERISDTTQTGPTFNVNTTEDVNDGQCGIAHCSLREAVIAANGLGQQATINVPAGTYNLSITGANEDAALTGDLDITNQVEIAGAGADTTIIDANGIDRVFDIINTMVTIHDVTIQGGNADYGGGIRFLGNNYDQGLTLHSSIVTGNTAVNGGGVAFVFTGLPEQTGSSSVFTTQLTGNHSTNNGGGIYSEHYTVTLANIFIDNNLADGNGGGIYSYKSSISNITDPGVLYGTGTISNNTALNGGGIFVDEETISTTYLVQTTLTGNHALNDGGGILVTGDAFDSMIGYATIADNQADSDHDGNGSGGGVAGWSTNELVLAASILYNNTANGTASDCYLDDSINYSVHVLEYTLFGDTTGCSFLDNTKVITGQDPLLGTLDYYGTDMLIYSLLPNSPALDLVTDPNYCQAGTLTDQRGITRPQGAGCDIGAYELYVLNAPTNLTVTAINNRSAQLSWTDNASDETNYFIERSSDAGATWVLTGQVSADVTSSSDLSLICEHDYQFRVRAYNSVEDTYSSYSNIASISMPSCIVLDVNTTADTDDGVCDINNCSLREAVATLNSPYQDARIINIPAGTYVLNSNLSNIRSSVEFVGSGRDSTIIDGNGFGIFGGISPGYLFIHDMTLKNGFAIDSGIQSYSQLRLENLLLTGNEDAVTANITNSEIYINKVIFKDNGTGSTSRNLEVSGAYGTVRVENSAFIDNNVAASIVISGTDETTTIANTTFGGNLSIDRPVFKISGFNSIANLEHTTIVGNYSSVFEHNGGNGIIYIYASIIKNNGSYGTCKVYNFAPIISLGYNIDSLGDCGLSDATDINGQDPLLGSLQQINNTWVQPPLPGSPAIDAIPSAECIVTNDQRGIIRPQGAGCDIGAYERIALDASSNLIATAIDGGSIQLDWIDNASNETAYYVERSDDGGSTWAQIAELPADSTSYTDSLLNCGTSYDFRVRSYNATDDVYSSYSDVASISTVACGLGTPSLSASAVGSDSVEMQWDDVAGETNYQIERSADGGSTWTEVKSVGADTTDYIDAVLPCSSDFAYRIRAYDNVNNFYSAYSNVISVQTTACMVPPPDSICTLTRFAPNSGEVIPVGASYLSGDGKRLVLAASDFSTGFYRENLYIYDVATTNLIDVIYDTRIADINYDGTRIVFATQSDPTGQNADRNEEVFLWDNGSITQLTNTVNLVAVEDGILPRISSDGNTIVFSRLGDIFTDTQLTTGIYYIWRDGIGVEKLLNEPTDYLVDLVPKIDISGDGSTVVFYHTGNLTGTDPNHEGMFYRLPLGGSIESMWDSSLGIVDSSLNPMDTYAINYDGSKVAFSLFSDPLGQNSEPFSEIFLWDEVFGLRQITDGTGLAPSNPQWPELWSGILPWIDSTGNRILFHTRFNLTGENPEIGEEVLMYDEGLGLSQLTNTVNAINVLYGRDLSSDGTRAAIIMPNKFQLADNENPTPYFRAYIADCTPPPNSADVVIAPANLTASPSGTMVSLTWGDFSSNETSFLLERSDDAGATWSQIADLPADTTSYGNTGLVCGTSYEYRIRSYSSTLTFYSNYSNVASVNLDCVLDAPTNLTTSNPTSTSIDLSWNDNATGETAYRVERSPDGTNWTEIAQIGADSTSYTDDTVTCFMSYAYRVRAYIATGDSYSDYSNVIYYADNCPIVEPSNLILSSPSPNTINLAWTDNSNYEEAYRIERSDDNGSTWNLLTTLAANSTSYSDTSVFCETAYSYRVRAEKASFSLVSNWLSGSTNSATCAAPSNLSAVYGNDTLMLTWTDNMLSETAYLVERNIDNGGWIEIASLAANTTEYIDSDISCDSNTSYRVRAYRDGDALYTGYSNEFALYVPPCGIPPAPSDLTVVSSTHRQVELSWTDNDPSTSNYVIERSIDSGATWKVIKTVYNDTTSYIDTGLWCTTPYQYRVVDSRAYDGVRSAYSNIVEVTTEPCPPLAVPPAPTAPPSPGRDKIYLTLSPDGTGEVSNFIIERSDDGGTSFRPIGVAAANSTFYIDVDLQCGTSYSYRIQSYRAEDNSYSPYSSVLVVVTAPCPQAAPVTAGLYYNGLWKFNSSNASNAPAAQFSFGTNEPGWIPLVGDWDGDGTDGIGLYKDGLFILRNNSNSPATIQFNFGSGEAGWIPVVGDWNGDDIDTVALYKNGIFQFRNSNSSGAADKQIQFGPNTAGWWPVGGDWTGKGYDTVGLYYRGAWMLTNSLENPSSFAINFGPNVDGWIPLAGDWNSNGIDGIGLYGNGSWHLKQQATSGNTDLAFLFGDSNANWLPVVGFQDIPPVAPPPSSSDFDGDGLSNGDENTIYHTDPTNPDTDGDGMNDGDEVASVCRNPLDPSDAGINDCEDTDSDSLDDDWEYWEFGCMSLQYKDQGYIVRPTGLIVDPVSHTAIQVGGVDVYATHAQAIVGHAPPYTDAELSAIANNRNAWVQQDCVLEERAISLYPDNISPYFSTYSDVGCVVSPDDPANILICPVQDLVEFTGTDDPDGDGCDNSCEQAKATEPIESLAGITDSDGDGLTDSEEINTYGTDPLNPDTDSDGLIDGQEVNTYHTNPKLIDTDSDGLSDGEEINTYSTNPLVADTDGDGLTDSEEINTYGTNPLNPDSDGDSLTDWQEVMTYGTNPLLADTDADGLSDSEEINSINFSTSIDGNPVIIFIGGYNPTDPTNPNNLNPLDSDVDKDGLMDGAEVNTYGTNPISVDTDGDTVSDGTEIGNGTDPLDSSSF